MQRIFGKFLYAGLINLKFKLKMNQEERHVWKKNVRTNILLKHCKIHTIYTDWEKQPKLYNIRGDYQCIFFKVFNFLRIIQKHCTLQLLLLESVYRLPHKSVNVSKIHKKKKESIINAVWGTHILTKKDFFLNKKVIEIFETKGLCTN